jgi:hypothetical protein
MACFLMLTRTGESIVEKTATEPKSDAEFSGSDNGGIAADSMGISESLKSRLESIVVVLVNSSPIMLFMKGTPEEPRCGFSKKVC